VREREREGERKRDLESLCEWGEPAKSPWEIFYYLKKNLCEYVCIGIVLNPRPR